MPPSPAVKGCFSHSRSHFSWTATTSYVARSPRSWACCSVIALSRSRRRWSRSWLVAQKNPPWQGGWPLGAIWSGDRSERLSKKPFDGAQDEQGREHGPRVTHRRPAALASARPWVVRVARSSSVGPHEGSGHRRCRLHRVHHREGTGGRGAH